VNSPIKPAPVSTAGESTVIAVLAAASLSHFLNDTIQSLLPAIYPVLKDNYALSFAQVGLITFVFQVTASLLQPVVGYVTDKRPMPYSLPVGMGASLLGLLLLAAAHSYGVLLVAAALVGVGSSVFHPEASRIARLASGGRYGFAQSFFQVGGNAGSALGPLLAAAIVVPKGQGSIAWFSLIAVVAIVVLWLVSGWYKRNHVGPARRVAVRPVVPTGLSGARTFVALAIRRCSSSPSTSTCRASRATTRSTPSRPSACLCRHRRSCCSCSSSRSPPAPSSAGRSAIASAARS
jgi:FSR family fosmidomycin resistance protein-like MFS transporter